MSGVLVVRYLEVRILLVFFQLFDEFLDVAGDLVATGDEESIIGVDDDQIFDADRRYEPVFALDEEVLAPEIDVFAVDDRVGT